MATPIEVRKKLESLTAEQFKQFQKDFGGGETYIPERYARELAQNPHFEFRMCELLGLPTEQERASQASAEMVEAAKASARSSAQSAKSAEEANAIAQSANRHADEANRIAERSAQATKEATDTARKAYRVAVVSLVVSAIISAGSLAVAAAALFK